MLITYNLDLQISAAIMVMMMIMMLIIIIVIFFKSLLNIIYVKMLILNNKKYHTLTFERLVVTTGVLISPSPTRTETS